MKNYKKLILVIFFSVLAVGVSFSSVSAEDGELEEELEDNLVDLLSSVDSAIRRIRFGDDLTVRRIVGLEQEWEGLFSVRYQDYYDDYLFSFDENLENVVQSLNDEYVPSNLENYYLESDYSLSENYEVHSVENNQWWVLLDYEGGINHAIRADNGSLSVYHRNMTARDLNEMDNESAKEQLLDFRNEIKEKAESEFGVRVPFTHQYASLIVLLAALGLSIVVALISRTVVDWKKVNRVKEKQSELKDRLKKARKENDTKKAHKLQKKQQQFMQEHMGTMFSPMKTMIIILVPFIIVFQILESTYGGWTVVWLPFELPWPDIGFFLFDEFFKGPAVSFSFFGWYMLVYFALAHITRKILVPGR